MIMNTPICDFVRQYAEKKALRLHMPGHKGVGVLGMEALDITEIDGADSLYEAGGIIRESEENASALFGCDTYYSTEGSSQCIRAMLYLALLHAKKQGRRPLIAAARNVHKTFLSAAALLDLDVLWFHPQETESYLSCVPDAAVIDRVLCRAAELPAAVYLTSPDYLGKTADIAAIAAVCRRHGVLLLVDNAHGAYLKFLSPSRHPIDLGADLCCDSAHKTLPVLTGGAYLHLSPAMAEFAPQAKNALALFGSTSPSYLILQSLDAANPILADYTDRLQRYLPAAAALKQDLAAHGWHLYGDEPLKITIETKSFGYSGKELAEYLLQKQIVCEFADPDYLVLMLTPAVNAAALQRVADALLALPQRPAITEKPPLFRPAERVLSVRKAALSPAEVIPTSRACGRILAAATVGCPPAVPILACGERIDAHALACFAYYGIETCSVVCE